MKMFASQIPSLTPQSLQCEIGTTDISLDHQDQTTDISSQSSDRRVDRRNEKRSHYCLIQNDVHSRLSQTRHDSCPNTSVPNNESSEDENTPAVKKTRLRISDDEIDLPSSASSKRYRITCWTPNEVKIGTVVRTDTCVDRIGGSTFCEEFVEQKDEADNDNEDEDEDDHNGEKLTPNGLMIVMIK